MFPVLDPRFKDRLFDFNSSLFDTAWVTGCREALVLFIETNFPSPGEPPNVVALSKSTGSGHFLNNDDGILGPDPEPALATNTTPENESVEDELQRYKRETPAPLNSDPLRWWKENKPRFPRLAAAARLFLAIPGRSCTKKASLIGF